VKEIIIFAENKVGVLAEITSILGEKNINVEDIFINTIGDKGVIIMKVDKYDESLKILRKNNFHVAADDLLVVGILDRPGELAKVAKRLSDKDINILSLHIISRDGKKAMIGITCNNLEQAKSVLQDSIVG
jgi:hypothetical protein